jgi:CheY-like chemotaxis protein
VTKTTRIATVLVIDDDPDFLEDVARMLAAPGYQVLRAADGREGLRLLEHHREAIDLAIIDLALPGVNGFEIIGAIARRPNSVKIIAATAVYKDSQLEIAGVLGAHAVLRKPAPGSRLPAGEWLTTVEKLIGPPERATPSAGADTPA